jgi:hypothetical protein
VKTEFHPGESTKLQNWLSQNPVDYVIITDSSLLTPMQRLANHKESRGIRTNITTTQTIYANYAGTDSADKIRNFIIDAYNSWGITWVVLGGDSGIIPPRYFFVAPNYNVPSDMYYACLDGSWDADGDGVYGESSNYSTQDEADYTPEVYVGRLPVATVADANTIVDKIIAFEQSTKSTKILFAGAKIDATTDGAYAGYHVINEARWIPAGYTVNWLYDTNSHPTFPGPETHNLTRTSFVSAFDTGDYTLICSGSHGSASSLYLSIGPFTSTFFQISDVAALTNTLTPFCILIGCNVAAWDYTNGIDCIGEALTVGTTYGAVGFISLSRGTDWLPGNNNITGCLSGRIGGVSALLLKQIFHYGYDRPGEALYKAKLAYVQGSEGYSTWNDSDPYERHSLWLLTLLGDPEMPIFQIVISEFSILVVPAGAAGLLGVLSIISRRIRRNKKHG